MLHCTLYKLPYIGSPANIVASVIVTLLPNLTLPMVILFLAKFYVCSSFFQRKSTTLEGKWRLCIADCRLSGGQDRGASLYNKHVYLQF